MGIEYGRILGYNIPEWEVELMDEIQQAVTENLNALDDVVDFSSFLSFSVIIDIIIKIAFCIAIVIATTVIIKLTKAFAHKLIYSKKDISERKAKTLNTVFGSLIRYFMYFFAICQILSIFGIDVTSFIAVAGVGSIAIAFGAQSLVQDIVSGIFILIEDQFAVGDVVQIEGYTGTVESIGIRTTKIRSADGNLFIIPNGQVKIITNMSKGFNRAVVDIGVAYEENIDNVIAVMTDELNKIYDSGTINGLLSKPTVLGIVNLNDSAVEIRISADTIIGENWTVEREIRRYIKKRFDDENIVIPYPQRVVHIVNDAVTNQKKETF